MQTGTIGCRKGDGRWCWSLFVVRSTLIVRGQVTRISKELIEQEMKEASDGPASERQEGKCKYRRLSSNVVE